MNHTNENFSRGSFAQGKKYSGAAGSTPGLNKISARNPLQSIPQNMY